MFTATVVAVLGLLISVGVLYLADQAGAHANLGTWSELLPLTLATAAAIMLSASVAVLCAFTLWMLEHKMASQLMCVVVGLLPFWVGLGVDSANVLLDTSEPVWHETRFLYDTRRKGEWNIVLQSWRNAEQTLQVENGDIAWERLKFGESAVIEVYAGALGRPYAVALCRRPGCED